MRRCERCHHVDFTERWTSRGEAEAAMLGDEDWRCEQCGSDEAAAVLGSGIGGG